MVNSEKEKSAPKLTVANMFLAFVMPTLVGKTLVFYFGIQYSNYPDEGYGVGLTLSILFTVVMLARFVWRFRDYEDE